MSHNDTPLLGPTEWSPVRSGRTWGNQQANIGQWYGKEDNRLVHQACLERYNRDGGEWIMRAGPPPPPKIVKEAVFTVK